MDIYGYFKEGIMSTEWLICQEPVHIGGADSSSRGNNNPIFRLSDRTPAIPGSSLRGALREHAEHTHGKFVNHWFGGQDNAISPGAIALGWGWPVWWPVHVLGYGNWWVSCLQWLNRFQQLSQQSPLNLDRTKVFISDQSLQNQTVYLRWLKLEKVQYRNPNEGQKLPVPSSIPSDRLIIVPDTSINLLVDMGLVRQPRVSLHDEPDEKGNLVKNLFGVEGFPPGAVFLTSWTTRGQVQNVEEWEKFLHDEHYLGGLWSVGFGRILIEKI
jgi:CRISPR/Cas system CMR subunit Cmr4 (Cas7 group RAMP superfamily)